MTAPTLPEWTKAMLPVDMDGAAILLGISRRFLIDAIKEHPHFERRGAKKVFYPEHITQLREAISCQGSSLTTETTQESGMPLELSEDSAFEKALALATRREPKKKEHSSKRGSGNVIPMVRKR